MSHCPLGKRSDLQILQRYYKYIGFYANTNCLTSSVFQRNRYSSPPNLLRNIPSSSYPIESVGFERPKNVTQSVTKHPKKAGMIPASKVFHTIDSKNSLWYTTIQQNMHMPDMA